MTTYNTPYKSGAITAVSGSTLTVSGMTPAAGDVGRILVLTSGGGELQHREIVGVSGQNITLVHSFDTNPFFDSSVDSRGSDVNPSVSDTFVISYDVSDLIAGDVDITQDDVNHLIILGMRAESGAYIHFKNYHVQLASTSFKAGDGGGFIFGYYNYVAGEDGYTKDSCHIVDTASGTGGDQFRVNTGSFGMLDIYGGSIYCPNTTFWRLYENAGVGNYQTRMFDVVAQGGLGGRIDGPRSFVKVAGVGGTSTFGIFNILSSPFRVELSALDCNQAIYLSLLLGPEGRTVLTRLADINNAVINVASGSSTGAGLFYEVIGKKSEIDAAPAFAIVDGSGDASHTIRYGNLIKPRFITQNLSLLAGDISTSLIDVGGNLISSQVVSGGIYPATFHRHTDIASTSGNKDLSDGTLYAPYTLNAFKYGYEFISQTISLEDTFDPDIIALPDSSTSESDKATVDAYPYVNSGREIHDAAASWLEDNLTTEQRKILTREGDAVDFGSYPVLFDKTAVSLFDIVGGTVVARVDSYTGLVKTTSTFATANGATQTGGVISVDGDSFLRWVEPVDSWELYLTESDADTTTNLDDSGQVTETYSFNYVGGVTYYYRAFIGTQKIIGDVTPSAAGETVIDLSNTAQLRAINASIQESSSFARYGDRITVNLIDGVDSTADGIGTPAYPTLSIANALVLAGGKGLKTIEVQGAATAMPQTVNGYRFIAGLSNSAGAKLFPTVSLTPTNGADNCEFEEFEVTGATDVSAPVFGNRFVKCLLNDLDGATGVATDCKLAGDISVTYALEVVGNSYGTVNFNVVGANARLNLPTFSGSLTISNMTSPTAQANIGVVAGAVTVDASCENCLIIIANADQVTNNSSTAVVVVLQDTSGGGGGGGVADWTEAERAQIRQALGVNGAKTAAVGGLLQDLLRSDDGRLDNLDASIASRLPASTYVVPPTVQQIDDQLSLTHGENSWEAGVGGGDDAETIYSYFTAGSRAEAFKADVGSIPTNPLLADDTRLDNLANADVATSSRLAAAGYTAPPSVAGLATTAQLNALQAHGDLNWQTATGFSSLTSADIQAELVAYGANKVAPDNAAITGLSAGLTYITKLIDNDSALLAADGVTPATPLNARFIVTYDDDGVTPLKTVNVLGVNGSPADMPNWSRYEKA